MSEIEEEKQYEKEDALDPPPSPPAGFWERQHTLLLIITTKPKVGVSQEIQNKQSAPRAPACIFKETIKEATSPGQPEEAMLKAPS